MILPHHDEHEPEMMSDPILWQVALTMENGTDIIKELDSTADLDRVQEIYNQVLTFAQIRLY